MKKILFLALFSASLFAGNLNIAVAANVSYAMDELVATFNKTNPDTKVQVTLGSSGKLTAQIKNGAPYEVFMAANMKFPQSLHVDGIAVTKPVVYAQGSLAIFSVKDLPLSDGIDLVSSEKVSKVAIANPKTAPYGTAALQALKNREVLQSVEKKIVYAESITQTVAYTITAADIGFIAKSSLYSPKMKQYVKDKNWVEVDSKLYTPIDQGIVILKNGESNSEAKAFYDFMLSDKAKEIFKAYGYLVP